MKDVLVQIIKRLMSSDTLTIRQATNELNECYTQPETIPAICDLIYTGEETQVRQYAALLLSARLRKSIHWNNISNEHKEIIRQSALNALERETEKCVRSAISVFVGILVRYKEDNASKWMNELFNFVDTRCHSSDEAERELGCSLFVTLIETAPDHYGARLNFVLNMFFNVLNSADLAGNEATLAIANLMRGMSYLLCFVPGSANCKALLKNGMPLILKTIQSFAYKSDANLFIRAFEFMDVLADFLPTMLRLNFKPMMELCLTVASNTELLDVARVQCFSYIQNLVRLKRKSFVKQQFLEPTITLAFAMMCDDSGTWDGVDDEDVIAGCIGCCSISAGLETIQVMSEHLSVSLLAPLLQLLEPALNNDNDYHKRAAYLCLGVIVNGCSEVIINKYLKVMCNVCWQGILNSSDMVRNAAFYALEQFSVLLQPEICEYLNPIIETISNYMHEICENAKLGLPKPIYLDRMFCCLENFTENLGKDIEPYLPGLMERLFECLRQPYSADLRKTAISLVPAISIASKEKMLPYFPQTVNFLETYLFTDDENKIQELRTMCIDTLAAIAREIGIINFYPLVNEAFDLCLKIMERQVVAEDPDCRRAIFNLIGSLSFVVKDEVPDEVLKIAVPLILHVLAKDALPRQQCQQQCQQHQRQQQQQNSTNMQKRDDDDDDDDDSDEDDHLNSEMYVENDYLYEKEEAVRVIKELCTHSYTKFRPYLNLAYDTICKLLNFKFESVRRGAIETLCAMSVSLYKLEDYDAVRNINASLLPKIYHLFANDNDMRVVTSTCDILSELMRELKEHTFPNVELCNGLFQLIITILNRKLRCQREFDCEDLLVYCKDEDPDEHFFGIYRSLEESAANMFTYFGQTMQSQEFMEYFKQIFPFLFKKLENAVDDDELIDIRASIYGVLGDCFCPMGSFCGNIFEQLCPVMLRGLTDTNPRARQNSCLGLGELVIYSKEKSYGSFPIIIDSLFNLMNKDNAPETKDYVCSTFARLILTNHTLVPLAQLIPTWLSLMPLRKQTDEYEIIFVCLSKIFSHSRSLIVDHLKSVMDLTALVLYNKYYSDMEACAEIINLLKHIKDVFPTVFHDLANVDADKYTYLNNILHFYF